jgi:hypothetical protein
METANKAFTFPGSGAPGSPVLVRPFFDVLAGQAAFLPVSVPGLISGSAAAATEGVDCESGRFFGADVHMIGNICCDGGWRWDFLIGYRYLSLDDRFAMQSSTVAATPAVSLNGQQVTSVVDQINTGNRFNGADFGLRWYWYFDRLMLRATARVAFGATSENASLNGETSMLSFPTLRDPTGVPTTATGGFLARPSNTGGSTNDFAVVPEGDITLVYQVCDWMRFTVGYSFLYWSSVARSGGQVNLNINRLEVPALSVPTGFAPLTPLTQVRCTDFWAHGLNVGLEFRF